MLSTGSYVAMRAGRTVAITALECHVVLCTKVPRSLFRSLKAGMHMVDHCLVTPQATTTGDSMQPSHHPHPGFSCVVQVGHLEHLVKLYSRGDIPHCDWLDILTLKVCPNLCWHHEQPWSLKQSSVVLLARSCCPLYILHLALPNKPLCNFQLFCGPDDRLVAPSSSVHSP